jgi:hypothetical protein
MEGTPEFEIQCDMSARLIDIRLRGFWDGETFDRFVAELSATERRLPRGERYRYLCDAEGFAVQQTQLVERFARFFERDNPLVLRTAIVFDSALMSLPGAHRRFFRDRSTAMAWLDEAQES